MGPAHLGDRTIHVVAHVVCLFHVASVDGLEVESIAFGVER
jgi:hypothetical protein